MESVLFELNEQFYLTGFDAFGFESNQSLKLTVGKTYRVLWGDSEWNDLTAYDAGALVPGGVYLGNASGFGLSGNNEPFIIASYESGVIILSLTDEEPVQRRVVVYGEAEKASGSLATLFSQIAGAIRGKNGEEGVEYYPAEFPGKIEDISAGGSSVKIATGSWSGTSTKGTFNHNLGEIPDLILVVPNEALSGDGTANRHYLCFGCSAKFAAAYPSLPKGVRVIYNSSKMYTYLVSKPMEENGSGNISNVTETVFSVSGPACSCAWIAIGGLT